MNEKYKEKYKNVNNIFHENIMKQLIKNYNIVDKRGHDGHYYKCLIGTNPLLNVKKVEYNDDKKKVTVIFWTPVINNKYKMHKTVTISVVCSDKDTYNRTTGFLLCCMYYSGLALGLSKSKVQKMIYNCLDFNTPYPVNRSAFKGEEFANKYCEYINGIPMLFKFNHYVGR